MGGAPQTEIACVCHLATSGHFHYVVVQRSPVWPTETRHDTHGIVPGAAHHRRGIHVVPPQQWNITFLEPLCVPLLFASQVAPAYPVFAFRVAPFYRQDPHAPLHAPVPLLRPPYQRVEPAPPEWHDRSPIWTSAKMHSSSPMLRIAQEPRGPCFLCINRVADSVEARKKAVENVKETVLLTGRCCPSNVPGVDQGLYCVVGRVMCAAVLRRLCTVQGRKLTTSVAVAPTLLRRMGDAAVECDTTTPHQRERTNLLQWSPSSQCAKWKIRRPNSRGMGQQHAPLLLATTLSRITPLISYKDNHTRTMSSTAVVSTHRNPPHLEQSSALRSRDVCPIRTP